MDPGGDESCDLVEITRVKFMEAQGARDRPSAIQYLSVHCGISLPRAITCECVPASGARTNAFNLQRRSSRRQCRRGSMEEEPAPASCEFVRNVVVCLVRTQCTAHPKPIWHWFWQHFYVAIRNSCASSSLQHRENVAHSYQAPSQDSQACCASRGTHKVKRHKLMK